MDAAGDRRGAARWITPASILCVYVLLLAVTETTDPGDTRDYANSITDRFAGRDLYFRESGYLLWRPIEWDSGGRVWISTGLLRPSPPAEWHWAEGDDNRVHWRDFPAFFNYLELGELGSGENSFVEVIASPRDVAILDSARRSPR
jgi:hypothetical protein